MNVKKQIQNYISSQPEPKRSDMEALHKHILKVLPKTKLWFLDGKDSKGKIVSNPNIGYGSYNIVTWVEFHSSKFNSESQLDLVWPLQESQQLCLLGS